MESYRSWIIEKSEVSCHCASRLVDKVKELPISERDRESLFVELHPLLYDLTKIVAYAYDVTGAWDANVANRILDQGTEGFKTVMCRIREVSKQEGFMGLNQMYPGSLSEPV